MMWLFRTIWIAQGREHILRRIIIASDNIDEVIALIKASKNTEEK
jgi:DNA gyrase subunit A